MLPTDKKDKSPDRSLPFTKKSRRAARNLSRATFLLTAFLAMTVMLAVSPGCAPSASREDKTGESSSSNGLPEITDETIRERIIYTAVREIPEENGMGEPITWRFTETEPKEITVVEKKIEAERATIILDIKTRSSPKARNQRSLAGQIRTEWELRTGWVLRRWEIVDAENISIKYQNLSKPPSPNSNN